MKILLSSAHVVLNYVFFVYSKGSLRNTSQNPCLIQMRWAFLQHICACWMHDAIGLCALLSSVVQTWGTFTSLAQSNAFCKGKHFCSWNCHQKVHHHVQIMIVISIQPKYWVPYKKDASDVLFDLFVSLFFMIVCIILQALMYTVSPFC